MPSTSPSPEPRAEPAAPINISIREAFFVWLRIALEFVLAAILWALPALGVRRAPAGG